MDRPDTPSRPPDYYDDELDHHVTPTESLHSLNAAAVRLLTSMEEPLSYVKRSPQGNAVPPLPLSISRGQTAGWPTVSTPEAKLPLVKKKPPPKVKFADDGMGVSRPPVRKPVPPKRSPTVKLRKKTKPDYVVQGMIAQSLPVIPEGSSPRRVSLKKSLREPSTPARPKPVVPRSNSNTNRHRSSRHSFQPSVLSDHSRHSISLADPPVLPPPDSSYVPYHPR